MKVYAYTYQYEQIKKEGYKSLSLIGRDTDIYKQRIAVHSTQAHSDKIEDIESYLEKTFKGRLRSICVLTEKAPRKKYKHPYFNNVANNATLLSFDLDELIKDGLVEGIYCKDNFRYLGTDLNDEHIYKVLPNEIDTTPIDWDLIGKHIKYSPWSCIRHYMIVLTKGYIPPKYVHLEYEQKEEK